MFLFNRTVFYCFYNCFIDQFEFQFYGVFNGMMFCDFKLLLMWLYRIPRVDLEFCGKCEFFPHFDDLSFMFNFFIVFNEFDLDILYRPYFVIEVIGSKSSFNSNSCWVGFVEVKIEFIEVGLLVKLVKDVKDSVFAGHCY